MQERTSEIIGVDVYLEKRKSREYVGRLSKDSGSYLFRYNHSYAFGERSIALGPDLPLSIKPYRSKNLFPTFEDRIPSRKNPAYAEYCKSVGVSLNERDPIVLVATLGRRGPSSFIFAPVIGENFTSEDLVQFRGDLNLTVREFADLFDFAPATIHRIEKGKSSGKEALKRIEIYKLFPNAALFEVKRNGSKIHDDKRKAVEEILSQ